MGSFIHIHAAYLSILKLITVYVRIADIIRGIVYSSVTGYKVQAYKADGRGMAMKLVNEPLPMLGCPHHLYPARLLEFQMT